MKQDILLLSLPAEQIMQLCKDLAHTGMAVSQTENLQDALTTLEQSSPAFLLLDLELEGARAFLAQITHKLLYPPPYIMTVAAFANIGERIAVLNMGSDACISNPVDAEEVLTLIRIVLRRERRLARANMGRLLPCIEHRELLIDPLRRSVVMRGEPATMTGKEFDILHLLASNPGAVLSKEDIYSYVWGTEGKFSSARISDHIFSIRKKLGLGKTDVSYIETIFGVGYRFAEQE